MKKLFFVFITVSLSGKIYAVEKSTKNLAAGDYSCYASTANAPQILPNRPNRTGYMLVNLATASIRVSFLPSYTGVLTSTNSIQIPANTTVTDQVPSVATLPLYCQGSATSAYTLSLIEFGQ